MRFNAKISACCRLTTYGKITANLDFQRFQFSKNKIWFTKFQDSESKYYLTPFEGCPITNSSSYTFDKKYNKEDKKIWVIKVNNDCEVPLKLNWWNKIKCNIIHHQYFLYREKEWFWKTIIAALIGLIMGLIGGYVGYRLGIQTKAKESQLPLQLSIPKQ